MDDRQLSIRNILAALDAGMITTEQAIKLINKLIGE